MTATTRSWSSISHLDQMGDEGCDVLPVLGCVLDHTQFERAEQFERQTILEGFLAKEHITLEEVRRIVSFGVPTTVSSISSCS